MILLYKCGHEKIGAMWKDGLVVHIKTYCPECISQNKLKPTTKLFRVGGKSLVVKLRTKGG